MKGNRKFTAAIALLFTIACSCLIAGCAQKEEGKEPEQQPETITLNVSEAELLYGETLQLIPYYTEHADSSLAWTTDDSSVATVSNGTVCAVGEGKTEITVTYGTLSAKCSVTVGFGNLQPSLHLKNLTGDKVRVGKNSSFDLDGYVEFNGREYPCELSVEIADENVLSFSDGAIVGIGVGTTDCTVKTVWNTFDGALLQKELTVEVFNDVSISALVTGSNGPVAAETVRLGLVSEWAGERYDTSVGVEIVVLENGERKTVQPRLVQEGGAVSFENGRITALAVGNASLEATFTDSLGKDYAYTLNVSVFCPTADYEGTLEFCTEERFPVEAVFGAGATLLSASRNGNALGISEEVIAIEANGDKTEGFEVLTDRGGYRFHDVFAYTRKINAGNFASTFTLTNGSVLKGYYILEGDAEGISVPSQLAGSATTYFNGTFDGRGHTLKASVGANGLFGAFGNGAVVENVRFELTFPASGQACGLAKNQGTFNNKDWTVTLRNVCVITTNYTASSYALMINKSDKLLMQDVYVKINGNSALGEFTDASSLRAALFYVDQSLNDGAYDQFTGGVRGVYVVSETFLPVSNGLNWSGKINYVSYAYNDADRLGAFTRENASSGAWTYCKIKNANEEGAAQANLFGTEDGVNIYTYLYGAHFNYKDGGIARFDTVEDLRAEGIEKVGDWTVE